MRDLVRGVRSAARDIRLFFWFNLLAFVAWGVLQLVFNLYLRELGLNEDAMGLFSAGQTLAMAATGTATGALFGRFGIWRCMVGGLALFATAGFGLALVESPPLLLLLAVLTGVGVSSLFAGTMPAIVEWVAPAERQMVSTVAFALVGFSMTFGSLLGGFLPRLLTLTPVWEYRWTILGGVALAAIALLPLLAMGPELRRPVHHAATHRTDEEPEDHGRTRADAAVFVGLSALYAIGYGSLLPFYNVYLASLGAGPQAIGAVYALSGFLQATLGLAAPALTRRGGSLWTVAGLRLAPFPLFAALLAVPSAGLAAAAYVARGGLFGPTIPTEATFVAETIPARARSAVFGWRFASWNLAWAAASAAAGWAIVRAGYGPAIVTSLLAVLAANVIWIAYFARHPRVRDGRIAGALPARAAAGEGA